MEGAAHAHRDGDLAAEAPELDGLLHDPAADRLGPAAGELRGHAGEDDGELVAADPAGQVPRPDVGAEDPGHRLEHGVTEGMAAGVIDPLEVVEVHQEERQPLAGAGGALHQLPDLDVHGAPVEEPGELVGPGQGLLAVTLGAGPPQVVQGGLELLVLLLEAGGEALLGGQEVARDPLEERHEQPRLALQQPLEGLLVEELELGVVEPDGGGRAHVVRGDQGQLPQEVPAPEDLGRDLGGEDELDPAGQDHVHGVARVAAPEQLLAPCEAQGLSRVVDLRDLTGREGAEQRAGGKGFEAAHVCTGKSLHRIIPSGP